jgi:hypothetical protein
VKKILYKRSIILEDGEGGVVIRKTGPELYLRNDQPLNAETPMTVEIAAVLVLSSMFEEGNQDLMAELAKRTRAKMLEAGVLREVKTTPEHQ